MARELRKRLILAGRLVAQSAIHTQGLAQGPIEDMPFALDGAGRFYLPGSGLCGVLRALWQACFSEASTTRVFGRGPGKNQDDGEASLILVEDAPLVPTSDRPAEMELRDHVAIDRRSGSARSKGKFDRSVLPPGSRFEFRCALEIPSPKPTTKDEATEIEQNFLALAKALVVDGITVGGGKSVGLGRVKLQEDPVITVLDFEDHDRFLAYLRGENRPQINLAGVKAAKASRRSLKISIDWQPQSTVMSAAGLEVCEVDTVPLTGRNGKGEAAFLLQGSSLKGAFRAQAERILATILGIDASHSVPLLEQLFGAKKDRQAIGVPSAPEIGQGALVFQDCHAETTLPLDDPRDPYAAFAKPGHDFPAERSEHVAIDRWTGGAADRMLFSLYRPKEVSWPSIDITLEPRYGLANEPYAALALLLLLLEDLREGFLLLGFGINKGFGRIQVERVTITAQGFGDLLRAPLALDGTASFLETDSLGPVLHEHLAESWKALIRACEDTKSGSAEA